MIKFISATNLRGLTFTTGLSRLNLLTGPNGSGKSARTIALELLTLGYSTSDRQAKPGSIMFTHASDDNMVISGEVENGNGSTSFGLEFNRKNDSVSRVFRLNGSKVQEREFRSAFDRLVSVVDVQAVLGQSDAKRIEWIMKVWPPETDLGKLNREEAKIKEQESNLRSEVKACDQAISRLDEEIARYAEGEIDSGTLATLKAELGELREQEKQYQVELDEIIKIEKADMKKRAEKEQAELKRRHEEATKAEAERTKKRMEEIEAKRQAEAKAAKEKLDQERQEFERKREKLNKQLEAQENFIVSLKKETVPADCGHLVAEIVADLERLKSTMEQTGCEVCAASILARKAIAKWGKAK